MASCSNYEESQNNNNIVFKSIVYDTNLKSIKNDKSDVLCEVLSGEEVIQTFLPEKLLQESGLLQIDEVKKSDIADWGEPDTKLLLDKYELYLDQIGPFKKFKNKKAMWEKISNDLKVILCVGRTAMQCENRFKTVLKRKTKIKYQNMKSGAGRTDPEFENELNKIKAKDDSVEPEILVGVGEIQKNKVMEKPRYEKEKSKDMEGSHIANILYKIHEEKEKSKERRHQEKMKKRLTIF